MIIKTKQEVTERNQLSPFVYNDWADNRPDVFSALVGSPGVTLMGSTIRIGKHSFPVVQSHAASLGSMSATDFEYLGFPYWYKEYHMVQFFFEGDVVDFAKKFPDIFVVSEHTSLSYNGDALDLQTKRREFIELCNTGNIIPVYAAKTMDARMAFTNALGYSVKKNKDFQAAMMISLALYANNSTIKQPLKYRAPNSDFITKAFILADGWQRKQWGHDTLVLRTVGLDGGKITRLRPSDEEKRISGEIVSSLQPLATWAHALPDSPKKDAILRVLSMKNMWGVIRFTQEYLRFVPTIGFNRFKDKVIGLKEKKLYGEENINRKARSLIFSSPRRGGVIPGILSRNGISKKFGQLKEWREGVKTYSAAVEAVLRRLYDTKV